jgi:hypothetical protein
VISDVEDNPTLVERLAFANSGDGAISALKPWKRIHP